MELITGAADLQLETTLCELCGEQNEQVLFTCADKYSNIDYRFPVVRCRNCGLVFVNPRPTAESISAFYPDEYYDAEVFHQRVQAGSLSWLEERRLSDIGRFAPGLSVLDVGCGAGQFLAAARDSGWETLGVEVSGLAAGYARDYYGLNVVQGDLNAAELPDGRFDVVTTWGVLEHLHHPKSALQQVWRVLKPGGLFVALVPNIGSTQAWLFGSRWHLLDIPRHLYHFSYGTLGRMASSTGFRRIWTRYFAREHDIQNLVQSLELVLHPRDGADQSHDHRNRRPWTWRRVTMGCLRRSAPVLARGMAVRRGSAAMEAYFIKERAGVQ